MLIRRERKSHQLGNVASFEFCHQMSLMNLDRARTDVKRSRDFLGVQALANKLKYFTLALSQLGQFQCLILARMQILDSARFLVQPFFNRRPQLRFHKRLLDKIDGLRLERCTRRSYVAVPGDDNERQLFSLRAQRGLQLETAHAGQSEIRDDAARPIVLTGVEKCFGALERYGAKTE